MNDTLYSTLSFADRKRKTLLLQLSVVVFIVTITYAVIDISMNIHVPPAVYIMFLALSLVTNWLTRRNHVHLTKILSLSFFNLFILLVASSEPFETGMHLHFVTVGTIAMALFGYERLLYSLFFVSVSFLFFMSTYLEWFTPEFMEYRQVNEDEARFFFVTNTIIASLVSVYSILMYARLSHETEENLLLNEKMVRDQNHQLLKTNDELDKLVYSISHDLRSPLASVLGLVHLAERSDNNRELKEYCQLIRQRIESLNAFISKTIHLVRNEKLGQVRELINLPFLVAEVFKKLNYTQGAGDIKFETKIDDSFSIETDPLALEIILSNLVSNAIKYRDHQKDNQFVRLSASQVNSTIEIVVEDNGIGIAPDLLKNIFNLFYRADSDKEGSGLGLFIVKDAVNKLDGQITVDSKVGIGTTFKISLRP